MENRELPFLTNFGFMLTYKCTIACPHCIVKAGPHRTEEMTIIDAVNWLEQIKTYTTEKKIVAGISLTGGEPFYNKHLLKSVADYAASLGFLVSVVTNAYWASTREKAIETVAGMESIGFFSISTDIYHQESIPLSTVKNAVFACKKLGKEYNIAVATVSEEDPDYLQLVDSLLEITEKDKIDTALLVQVGRAEKEVDMQDEELSPEPSKAACSMASFPVLFPNGKVIACIGPPIVLPDFNPLHLGNLHKESLSEIIEKAEKNPILHAIRTFGPSILVEQLREKGYSDLLPENYQVDSICDICNKLFSNRAICKALEEIESDELFRKKIAYGRYYYLGETEMIDKLNLVSE
jgi:MoaA/NifB/PqqE/SkfB family radical SAM enzyme